MTAKIGELEDIMMTMKFEINGLKAVISALEEGRREEKERSMSEARGLRGSLEMKGKEAHGLGEKVCQLADQ